MRLVFLLRKNNRALAMSPQYMSTPMRLSASQSLKTNGLNAPGLPKKHVLLGQFGTVGPQIWGKTGTRDEPTSRTPVA